MNPDNFTSYLDEAFDALVKAARARQFGQSDLEDFFRARVDRCLLKVMVWAERFKMQQVRFK